MSRIGRRELLGAGAAMALGGMAYEAGAQATPSGTAPAPPATPKPVAERLVARALENVHAIARQGSGFSGSGWDLLVREGSAAQYFLLGEEHGTAEIPVLAAALFAALRPAGYRRLAIELSDPIAADLDRAAQSGLAGLKAFTTEWNPGPAFYNWRPEAEMLAAVRAQVPKGERAFWGLDYEVATDRRLIARLAPRVPARARAAFAELERKSTVGWDEWRRTGKFEAIPTFTLDPALVSAIEEAWPRRDAESTVILEVLRKTLEINRAMQTSGWQSNQLRAEFMRANLLRLLAGEPAGEQPRVMFKFGSNHMMRGVNATGGFDLGSLVPELAAIHGGKSFHLLVGGTPGGQHGVIDPRDLGPKPAPTDMLDPEFGLGFLLGALPKTGLALLDLRPLRRIVSNPAALRELGNSEAVRTIHAFDALLVWNGTTATTLL